ncbi:MAG: rhomboid family intramembrane serine protease [Breznakia sp.]
MKIDSASLAMSQVMDCLIREYGYTPIRFPQQRRDVWLINKEHPQFKLIRIIAYASNTTLLERAYLDGVERFLKPLLSQKADVFVLNTNEESEAFQERGYVQELVNIKYISEKVLQVFPNMYRHVYKSEDPTSELRKINEKLKRFHQQKKEEFMNQQRKIPPLTCVIFGICITMYVFTFLLAKQTQDWNVALISLGAYYKAFIVSAHEYWRFLTAGFLHADLVHLLVNMLAFISLGRILEKVLKPSQFIISLLGSIILGSIFTYLMSGNVVSVGLSGGLYGFLAILCLYMFESGVMKNPQARMAMIQTIALNVLISFMPGIGLYAHLGGFVAGLCFGFIFIESKRWQTYRSHIIVCLVLSFVFLGYRCAKVDSFSPIYGGTDQGVIEVYRCIGLDGYARYVARQLWEHY